MNPHLKIGHGMTCGILSCLTTPIKVGPFNQTIEELDRQQTETLWGNNLLEHGLRNLDTEPGL